MIIELKSCDTYTDIDTNYLYNRRGKGREIVEIIVGCLSVIAVVIAFF
jgi:hypothetical protein